jgi:hypothetical protein
MKVKTPTPDHRKPPIQKGGNNLMPPSYGMGFIDNHAVQRKKNTTGMPDQLKSGVESLSGIDMSDVKVHYNSSQPAQLNAHAYAQGNQIHVAPGQEKHLPHEAWHVVQQKQGRVKPTRQLKGKVNVNDDAGLEKEADVMGGKAMQRSVSENSGDSSKVIQNKALLKSPEVLHDKPVQRALIELNEPSVKGETRNNDVALQVMGDNWYRELNNDIEVEYLPETDQYRLGNGNYWDPVANQILISSDNNVYTSEDGNHSYNYVRGRYIPVGDANIDGEPVISGELTNFLTSIWGVGGVVRALPDSRSKMNYIYSKFYAKNGGTKAAPLHSSPLIADMVRIAAAHGGHVQFGVNIPDVGVIEDPSAIHRYMRLDVGTEQQRIAAYTGLANCYYYFRVGNAPARVRIIINTSPAQTPGEFEKVYAIVSAYADVVADIKVAGPMAAAKKMDSMVMYLNNGSPRFQTFIDALVARGIATVNELPAMIRSLSGGIGYAHEPPVVPGLNGLHLGGTTISFGEKRVILAFMAFERSSTLNQFKYLAAQFFEDAGIDTGNPHREKGVTRSPTVIAHLRAYLSIMSRR